MTLAGKHILVTAGPTHEPIDPVRVIANRSSGRQGFAIAAAAAEAGARVTLVAGPVALETPPGVTRIDVETAEQMAEAVMTALPADAAVLVAAVADWRVEAVADEAQEGRRSARSSASCRPATSSPSLARALTPAAARRLRGRNRERRRAGDRQAPAKRADWIVANDVSGDVMGGTATASTSSPPKASKTGRRRRRTKSRASWSRGSPKL